MSDTKGNSLDDALADATGPAAPSVDTSAKAELALLKEQAKTMGLTFHPTIQIPALRNKIDDFKAGADAARAAAAEDARKVEAAKPAAPLTEYQINAEHRANANRLVRIVVSCMNPAKQALEGEYFTCGNAVIGTQKKLVPFNLDAGFHVPYMMYEVIRDRMCQTFYTVTDPLTRVKYRKGRQTKEFNIVVLPPLTKEELAELATQQAVGQTID